PAKIRGIDLWQQLRDGSFENDAADAALQSLRSFLSSVNKPKRIKAPEWHELLTFIREAANESALDFVRRFEWSCGGLDSEDVASEVRRRVGQVAAITDDLRTNEMYDRLFLFVLLLLTQPGIKRLTAQLLAEQL